MRTDRYLGIGVFAFGLILMLVLIPNNVTIRTGAALDPSLFPRISGWMFLVLGALLFAFPGDGKMAIPLANIVRMGTAVAAMALTALAMQYIGFFFAAIALMTVVVILVAEKRPLWVAVAIGFIPAFVWTLFEIVLERPLP